MHTDKVSTTGSDGSRKSSKPVMEKRRRARINSSLAELKDMLMDVMKAEGACHNKMEKADILEMTVRHLRHLQKQQYTGPIPSDVSSKYRMGYTECASEIRRLLESIETVDVEAKTRVIQHLANCVCKIVPPDNPGIHSSTPLSTAKVSQFVEIRPSKVINSSPNSSTHDISTSQATHSSQKPIKIATSAAVSQIGNVTTTTSGKDNGNKEFMEVNSNSPDMVTTTTLASQPLIVRMPHNSSLNFESCASAVDNTSSSSSVFSASTSYVSGNMPSAFQLLPSGLASGNFAFIIPTSVVTAGQLQGYVLPVYTQSAGLSPVSYITQGKCNAGETVQGPCHSSGVPFILEQKSPEKHANPIQNVSALGSSNVYVFPFTKNSVPQSISINVEDNLPRTLTQQIVPSISNSHQSFVHFQPFPSAYEQQQQQSTQNMWRPW
ncbi:hypothetical protein ACJMK2_008373 [Sinanodonta woodiana]|uniref:Uncharacterized protein n=1 Tax=Sinanodonta woodiana TaxID=1069815 RepID=A0ABD3VLE0_SINWO